MEKGENLVRLATVFGLGRGVFWQGGEGRGGAIPGPPPSPSGQALTRSRSIHLATVYVANFDSNTVSVINESGDAKTGKVTATIAVGSGPDAVAVDSSNHNVYVANGNGDSVSVIDESGEANTGKVTATISVPGYPNGIAVDPVNHNVYISSASDSVSVIDESGDSGSGQVVDTIGIPPTGGPNPVPDAVAVDPTTHNVYVADGNADTVSMIDESGDANTGKVTATIGVGSVPNALAVDPSNQDVYVTNSQDFTVSVIQAADNTVTATLGQGTRRSEEDDGVAVDPTSHNVYVTDKYKEGEDAPIPGRTLSVIDESGHTGSGTVIANISVGSEPVGVAVDPSNDNVYTANENSGTVSVVMVAGGITAVTLKGIPDDPQVTVKGLGFGSNPPTGYSANDTACGDYSDNGDWYANNLAFDDISEFWQAGQGTAASNANCVGIIIDSWSNTKIVFQFGDAYGSNGWFVDSGDQFTLQVNNFAYASSPTFTPLTLENGWTNAPYSTGNAAATSVAGIVYLKGAIATTGTNAVPFTLPPNLSPTTDVYLPVDLCGASTGRLFIQPDGEVTVETLSGDFSEAQCLTSLDGASFALTGSTALTLENGWTNAPYSTSDAAATSVAGIVYLKGAIATTGTNAVPFTLPPNLSPATDVYLPVDLCDAITGRLFIQPSGEVTVETLSGDFSDAQCFTSLDGASFALSGSTPLTLENGWTNAPYSTSDAAATYVTGIVHLKGAIATTGTNAVPFTLPPSVSPASDVYIPVDLCDANTGDLLIKPNGEVTVETLSGDFSDAQCFTSLDGASFAPGTS